MIYSASTDRAEGSVMRSKESETSPNQGQNRRQAMYSLKIACCVT
jgi:hypothetical protein